MSIIKEYDKLVLQNREALETMLLKVDKAICHGLKNNKIQAISSAIRSGCIDEKSYISETQKIFIQHNIPFTRIGDLYKLDDRSLRFCTIGCYNAIANRLASNEYYYNQYNTAYSTLFKPETKFKQEQVLHSDEKGNNLKVSDLLSLVDYALTFAKSIKPNDESYKGIEVTTRVLQSIDCALNNKPEDKPTNKLLHLAVGFISGAVMENISNPNNKQAVAIGTGIINLAIDFLCKR